MSTVQKQGEQKILFLSSSDELNNSSWPRGLSNNFRPHLGNKLHVYDFPERRKSFHTSCSAEIFIDTERTRSDLEISHSGVTVLITRNKQKSHELGCPILSRTYFSRLSFSLGCSGTIGEFLNLGSHQESLIWSDGSRVSRFKPWTSQNNNSFSHQ